MKRLLVFLALAVAFANLVSAVEVAGEVYSTDFEIVSEVVVKVLSTGGNVLQSEISESGRYEFGLSEGEYIVKAEVYRDGILVLEGGERIEVGGVALNVDLIVLPSFGDEELFDNFDVSTDIEAEGISFLILAVIAIAVAAVIAFYYWKRGPKPKEELPKDLKEIVKMIERKGGRVNQVDLRKELQFSEAKVSLMLADLENRGWIKRIKKGRGNILVLQ
ncbi:hypothetical protein GW924_01235 [Candidatus Pacearchaeota archaeon]|nr:hypothetical protein [Candidatus Pacearchaeota archaeon]